MSPQRTCRSLLPDPVCLEVRCRNSGPGGMGKGREDLFSSVTSPSTLQHNRVIYLPTLSATSTIRKKLKGWDTGRESLPLRDQVWTRLGWRELKSRKH